MFGWKQNLFCRMTSRSLNVSTLPNAELAFLNKAFVSPAQYTELSGGASGGGRSVYIAIQSDVFLLGYSDGCANGDLCISGPQRMTAKLQMQEYPVKVFPGTQVSPSFHCCPDTRRFPNPCPPSVYDMLRIE